MADMPPPAPVGPSKPSMKGTGKGRAGPKRRVKNTCRQCRERKAQCSRGAPCDTCVRRGIGHLCDWEGAVPTHEGFSGGRQALQHNRDKNDAEAVTSRVQRVLDLLESAEDEDRSSGYRMLRHIQSVPLENADNDLATQLSTLSLEQAVPQHRQAVCIDGITPIKEQLVTEVSDLIARDTPSVMSSPPQGILGIGQGPATVEELLAMIPTKEQAFTLFRHYSKFIAWMHRIICEPTFVAEMERFWPLDPDLLDSPARPERLAWLAVLFAVCGLAMYTNGLTLDQTTALGLPPPNPKEGQKTFGRKWLQCAGSALNLGSFMEQPTVTAIKAMTVLVQLPLYISNGEHLGSAISFLTLGLTLAENVGLTIDPDDSEEFKNASDMVKHDRRRIMCALLCADWKMSSLICRRWALTDPGKYHVKLPFDVFDTEFDPVSGALLRQPSGHDRQQTYFTALNARVCVSRLWQRIGISFADLDHLPTHANVMAFDKELTDLEASFPHCIRTRFDLETGQILPPSDQGNCILATDRLGTYAVLAATEIRLHRGFLVPQDGIPASDVNLHRSRVYYYGRMLLACERSGFYPLECVPLQFFVLSAGIALCVYCLTAPDDDPSCNAARQDLHYICSLIHPFVATSSILRRSFSILRYLLNRDVLHSEAVRQNRNAKRIRTAHDAYVPHEPVPPSGRTPSQSGLHAFDALRPSVASRSASEDSFRRRRPGPSAERPSTGPSSSYSSLGSRPAASSSYSSPGSFVEAPAPRPVVNLPHHQGDMHAGVSGASSAPQPQANQPVIPENFAFDFNVTAAQNLSPTPATTAGYPSWDLSAFTAQPDPFAAPGHSVSANAADEATTEELMRWMASFGGSV